MGLEPTTLRDLVGCSNHWATGDSMVSEGQFVGLDWNRIARLHSQVLVSTCENSLTASRCHIKAYQDAANQPPKWAYKDETIWHLDLICYKIILTKYSTSSCQSIWCKNFLTLYI